MSQIVNVPDHLIASADWLLATAINPALEDLERIAGIKPTDVARRNLVAISVKEADAKSRHQILDNPDSGGPARGLFQFERGGGVKGVMQHPASSEAAKKLCEFYRVEWNRSAIWRTLEGHDRLAAVFARLLLYTDPRPLRDDQAGTLEYYLANWRPGVENRAKWPMSWATAVRVVPRGKG